MGCTAIPGALHASKNRQKQTKVKFCELCTLKDFGLEGVLGGDTTSGPSTYLLTVATGTVYGKPASNMACRHSMWRLLEGARQLPTTTSPTSCTQEKLGTWIHDAIMGIPYAIMVQCPEAGA